MCHNCYEDRGKPSIITPKTKAAAKLIEELYEWCPSGGRLHIVVDDYNIDQENIDYCAKVIAAAGNEALSIERACCEALVNMTTEERGSAIALYEGWLETN